MRGVIAFGAGVVVGLSLGLLRRAVACWWRQRAGDRLNVDTLERRQMAARDW